MEKINTENAQKFITCLLQEDFILLSCAGTHFFYDKKGKLFLLNPFKHTLEGKDSSFCECKFPHKDMSNIWEEADEKLDFENPPSNYFYKDFNFKKMSCFFKNYGENPDENPVFNKGTKSYWACENQYWSVDTESNNKTLKDGLFDKAKKYFVLPYCWPSFEIQDSLEADNWLSWLSVLCKYKIKISYLEDDTYKEGFLKRHADFTREMLDEIKSSLEELENMHINDFDDTISNPQKTEFIDELCKCDQKRAGIQSYDEKMLRDPNKGHWDLTPQLCKQYPGLYSRDPKNDVHEYGIVGIDFGTKSTVVVYQSRDNKIHQICVGKADFSQKLEFSDYENPTIIELISYDDFVKTYKNGSRPQTKWEDLKVSYTAKEDLEFYLTETEPKEKKYRSFFSDLKRWAASSSDKTYTLQDDKKDIKLKPYKTLINGLEEDEFDPIEIYAYYLGLYINNMRNGIFLDYYLSFPVTFSESVRHHITQSFERGLKKSLPDAIFKDKKLMERFSINTNISEPAAYAVCAMQEYGFEPEDNEKVYFGIFDFGGGTADFEFGSWSGSSKSRYDYKITHYQNEGDKFLGGENLLELVAFNIFKDNADTLRKQNIKFKLPAQCQRFVGSEGLIDDSAIADYNMKSLMEKIRPIWEEKQDDEDENAIATNQFAGSFEPMLIPSNGKIKSVKLKCDKDYIEKILRDRIKEGIYKFFASFKEAWKQFHPSPQKFYILLAGNSSKSHHVEELFKEAINEYTKKWKKLDEQIFEILPPIGTSEFKKAREDLLKKGIVAPKDDDEKETEHPTGKTGVAFGLLIARKGGRIEMENYEKELPFKYYVGTEKRGKFKMLDKEFLRCNRLQIGLPCKLCELEKGDTEAELYFTTNPQAADGTLSINSAKKVICRFPEAKEDGQTLYITAKDTETIEYAINKEKCLGKIRLSEENN